MWSLKLFILAVTEIYSSYEKLVCDSASNNQIEKHEFYNMNQNSTIDFTTRNNKNEVTLYCRKFDPDVTFKD